MPGALVQQIGMVHPAGKTTGGARMRCIQTIHTGAIRAALCAHQGALVARNMRSIAVRQFDTLCEQTLASQGEPKLTLWHFHKVSDCVCHYVAPADMDV